ncbi:MAG: hypothetical protein ACOY9J_13155 [Pseudomonadota bacterium]
MKRSSQSTKTGSPLPADLAAVWGGFLFEGLLVGEADRSRRVLDAWNQGCIELVWHAGSFLPEVWRQVEPRWRDPQGFPGVFEYEVISEFGTMLGDHVLLNDGELPTLDHVRRMIHVLLADFFSQGEKAKDGHRMR